ncbi:MAG: imidazole glycerol phosphate synthase subunit HisF [Treponema sp.]|nr:imidazole glycerol phosphate synthase subunit HisF [Treponema sp.]
MSVKRIIPCLDVDDGKVVKGIKFEGIKEVGDPVELAKKYCADGADELAFLDIGASVKSRATLIEVVKKTAKEVSVPFCVGGGIRSVEDASAVIEAGVSKVSVCSSALVRPQLLRELADAFGSKSVMLAIDAKKVADIDGSLGSNEPCGSLEPRWNAFSKGGKEDSGVDAIEWAVRAVELGAGEIMVNSIDADGTCEGYDIELTRRIASAVSVPVIASGGAGTLEQIAEVLLNTNADAALVASLLHFEKTTVTEIKKYLENKGINVRR